MGEHGSARRSRCRRTLSASWTLAAAVLLAAAGPVRAQLHPPRPHARRTPAAGPTRLPDGRPGPGYWQQRVAYAIDATLDTARHRVVGVERVTYHNDSPDTLRELYWHLDPNLFRARDQPNRHLRIVGLPPQATDGMVVHDVALNDVPVRPEVSGTLMRTPLPVALAPGDSLRARVSWDSDVPEGSELRTGRIGADYGVAQWYPQVAVYDDVSGWDATPYLGQGEFYLEYGEWDVRLRVPAGYVVAATGMLLDPDSVLTPEELARLGSARADTVVDVIPRVAPRPASERGWRRWHFRAREVRDFAWAASPNYLWEATRMHPTAAAPEGTLVSAFYHPADVRYWRGSAGFVARVMEFYAARFGDYPYPQVSAVSGPVTGMEYPMLVFGAAGSPVIDQPARVLAHELGHQWFPMIVGSDENRFAALDEGFVTFMTALALDDFYGRDALLSPRLPGWARALLPRASERRLDQTVYLLAARAGHEVPMLTPADEIPPELYGVAAYMKPGTVLFMLRDVLGAGTLDRAMRSYVERWRFRHPYPDDYFHTIEDVAGRNLHWFWTEWFRQTWTLDLALDGVRQREDAAGWSAALDVRNRGRAIMPATIRLRLENGSTRDVRLGEAGWRAADARTLVVDSLPARVASAEIDPDLALADVDRLDNRWPRARVAVDWRPDLLADLLPPLDAYRVGLHPSVWYTRAGGAELGLGATGSYFGTDDRVSALLRLDTRDGRLDGEIGYRTPLRAWGDGAAWWVDAFRLEGRTGGGIGLELAPGAFDALLYRRAAATHFSLRLDAIAVGDSAFLETPSEWAAGTLVSVGARLSHEISGEEGSGSFAAAVETGGPGSGFAYGKATLELRGDAVLGERVHLLLRGIGGYASGRLPPQTAFYLADTSPVERFRSPLFRSAGVLDALGLGRTAVLGGGGGVPGAALDRHGSRLAAVNAALQWGALELFGDGGDSWNGGFDLGRWTWDAGVGAGFDLRLGEAPVRPGHIGVHLRVPLWVSDPVRPERSGWGPKWRLVFGARWGG